jgi:hypothetical protein
MMPQTHGGSVTFALVLLAIMGFVLLCMALTAAVKRGRPRREERRAYRQATTELERRYWNTRGEMLRARVRWEASQPKKPLCHPDNRPEVRKKRTRGRHRRLCAA